MLEGRRMPWSRTTAAARRASLLPCDVRWHDRELGRLAFVVNGVANDFPTLCRRQRGRLHLAALDREAPAANLMSLVYNLLDRKYSDVAVRFNFDPVTFGPSASASSQRGSGRRAWRRDQR
jgi:hypothetical protein